MDTAELALAAGILACCLIALEWSYVYLTFRRLANRLGFGRRKAPAGSKPDQLGPTVPAGAAGGVPPPAAVSLAPEDIDLDSPIASQFIDRIAANMGVDRSVVRQYAEQALGPAPATGGVPNVSTPAPAGVPQADAFGSLLTSLLTGEVDMEKAAVSALPMVISALTRPAAPNGAEGPVVGYW